MRRELVTLAVLLLANIPVYILIGYAMFDSWGGFWECLKFWFTPDMISLFRGEYEEDWWAEMKLGIFIAACALCIYGEYSLISKYFFS